MDRLIGLHKKEYGREPDVVVSAPGTVNLIGEHTDYNDGLVLSTAIDRYLTVAVSVREDNSLRFYAADLNERKRTSIPNLKFKREDRWANYPKGVLHELMQLGYSIRGLDFSFTSDIPTAIGLGASAALGVATAVAVSELLGFELTEFQIIQSAAMAESAFIGIDTPLTDQLISTVAKANTAVYLDLRTLDYEYVPLNIDGARILITNSSVPVVAAYSEIRDRKEKCSECVTHLKRRRPGTVLGDFSSNDLRNSLGIVSEDIRRLCMHVLEENERVKESRRLINRSSLEAFGKLMNRSHESLRDNYEVSCPEIDWLVKRAWEIEGIFGSRLTGPGFGGCTVTLIQEAAIEDYRERLSDYERIFGFTPVTFVVEAANGVHIVPRAVKSA